MLFLILYRDPVCLCEYSHAGRDGSSFLRLYSTPTCLGIKFLIYPIHYTAWAFSTNAGSLKVSWFRPNWPKIKIKKTWVLYLT